MNGPTPPDFLPRHAMSGVIDTHALMVQVHKLAWQQAALRLWEVFEQFPEVHSCIPERRKYISLGRGRIIYKFQCHGEDQFLPKAQNDAFISAIQGLPFWQNKGDKGSKLITFLLENQLYRKTYWQQVEMAYDKKFGEGHFKTAQSLADQEELDQNLGQAGHPAGKPFRL